jgi:hypothetical protein
VGWGYSGGGGAIGASLYFLRFNDCARKGKKTLDRYATID